MKIIIDTSNKDLFISLIKDNKTIKYELVKDLVKKADELPLAFKRVMGDLKTTEIKEFYITIGPGSFTGARISLVFARSICQITNAKLYTTTSIQMIAGPIGIKEVFIDARSNMSYYAKVVNGNLTKKIKLVIFQDSTIQKFDGIISNPTSYLSLFKIESNILDVHPLYIKEPKIGN